VNLVTASLLLAWVKQSIVIQLNTQREVGMLILWCTQDLMPFPNYIINKDPQFFNCVENLKHFECQPHPLSQHFYNTHL